VLVDASAQPSHTSTRRRPGVRVVLGLTGAVQTMHAPGWVSALLARGYDVRIAATRKALRFVRREALEALTHQPVYCGVWSGAAHAPVPHIELAEWADLVLVHPATATTLSRIAQGNCSDLVAAIAITTRAPVVLAPSMNPAMLSAPAVQRNLELLREDGFYLAHPSRGVEVAWRPDARVPVFGPAPPFDDVLALAEFVLRTATGGGARVPADAREWEALYASAQPGQLVWDSDRADTDEIATLTEYVQPSRRVLDVGAGTGAFARAAAALGYRVTATEIAPTALHRAHSRDGGADVTWVVDDALDTRVVGRFDAVHDRGCLHLLPPARHAEYVRQLARWLEPGAIAMVKVHSDALREQRGTRRFTEAELRALFEPAFEVLSIRSSEIVGASGPAAPAWLGVFRSRATP
jgi:3-polyprenyl-4-hydroxybenzoate decarboxylase